MMDFVSVVGVLLAIAGSIQFWRVRRRALRQKRAQFADKAMAQCHELAALLNEIELHFTPSYLDELAKELDPNTFADLTAEIQRAESLREKNVAWAGRNHALNAVDDPRVPLKLLVQLILQQDRIICEMRSVFSPFIMAKKARDHELL